MKQVILILISLVIVGAVIGPFAQSGIMIGFQLLAVSIWCSLWILGKSEGLLVAIVQGLIIDLISFEIIGRWLVTLVLVYLLGRYLMQKYLDINSPTQGLIILSLMSLLLGVMYLLQFGLSLNQLFLGILFAVVTGAVIFYFFSFRLRLFMKWAGRRL